MRNFLGNAQYGRIFCRFPFGYLDVAMLYLYVTFSIIKARNTQVGIYLASLQVTARQWKYNAVERMYEHLPSEKSRRRKRGTSRLHRWKQTNERMNGQIGKWMGGRMNEWMNEWMDGWMNRCRMNGWTDEWMNKWMDEWMGGRANV